MDPHKLEFQEEFQQEVLPPIFDTECINFRSLSGQLFKTTYLPHQEDSPMWTKAYNKSGLANAEQRLFGRDNYRFFIGTIQCLSGNHQIQGTQGPKDFQLDKQSLESNYDPHSYLLRGQGFPWYTVLMRAQIHTNTQYICSNWQPEGSPGVEQELKQHDDNLFTNEEYN